MIIKKNVLVFCDDSEEHSIDLARIIEKSKYFKIKVIIVKKKTQNKKFLKKINFIKNKNNIFFENYPHKNKKITLLIQKYKINTGFVFSYQFKLKELFLKKFDFGLINFHPGFLPDVKGSHSSFWSIYTKKNIGCSMHFMNNKIDSGKIIDVYKINIKGIILADKVFYLTREKMKILLKRNLKKIYEEKIIKLINPKTKIYYKKDILKAINLDFNKTIKISKLFDLIRSTHINNHGIFLTIEKRNTS